MALRQAVSRLRSREQVALVLRFYEGLSVAESARVMACPKGTVKALTHRGLAKLRADIGSDATRGSTSWTT